MVVEPGEFAQIKRELELASERLDTANRKFYMEQAKYDRAIVKEIFEQDLLLKTEWIYDRPGLIRAKGGCDALGELISLWLPDYHQGLTLQPSVYLQRNDWDIQILFINHEDMFPFIQEHQLRFSIKPLEEQRDSLQARLDEVTKIIDEINKNLVEEE